jgi:hypothetical protein
MKKTSKIHLVLVTTVLTACNRMIIPDQPEAGYTPDPSMTVNHIYGTGKYDCDCRVDTTYYNYPENYFSFYYTGQPYGYRYRSGYLYRRGAYWHNHAFIVRGGFGKTAASSAS